MYILSEGFKLQERRHSAKNGRCVMCREKFEIEVALNSEMSSQVEPKGDGKNAECSCSNSNGNQHAHGEFPKNLFSQVEQNSKKAIKE